MSRGAKRFSDPNLNMVASIREAPTLVPPPPAAPDCEWVWHRWQLCFARLSNEERERFAAEMEGVVEGRKAS